ncbi:hypothetical protein ACHAXR_009224 [Thalassiosira sp. AJA248-18]
MWSLVCIALLVALASFSILPSRSINLDTGRGNLRAHHTQNNTASVKADDGSDPQNELLTALYDLPLPTSIEELEEVNEELKDLDPEFILQWAHHHLVATPKHHEATAHPLVQVTSFGPTGLVILDILSQLHLLRDVPIITMDTLHLFPESYDFYKTIQSQYGSNEMNLVITKPLQMNDGGVITGKYERREEFEETYGSSLWKEDPQRFTKLTKIGPLNKVLGEWQTQGWITGRRRSSGGERLSMNVLEFDYITENGDDGEGDQQFDMSKGRWKLNPLAYWTYTQVWNYIHKHNLPYNVLFDQGYTSLGDEMTTGLPKKSIKTEAGEALDVFERSGRFISMGNKTECGLHSHLRKVNEQKQQALEAGEEFTAPTLVCNKCLDLTADNFEHEITHGEKGQEMLLEFYSPFCGGCQNFAPTLNSIAEHLSANVPNIQVARFDITENEVPNIHGKEEFIVESTPTLYRVHFTPFYVELYEGKHSKTAILRWLTETPETIKRHAKKKGK